MCRPSSAWKAWLSRAWACQISSLSLEPWASRAWVQLGPEPGLLSAERLAKLTKKPHNGTANVNWHYRVALQGYCKGTQSPTRISGKLLNPNSEYTPSMRNSVHSPVPKTTPKSNSEPISIPTLVHQRLRLGLVNVLRDTSELDSEVYPIHSMSVIVILSNSLVWTLLLL